MRVLLIGVGYFPRRTAGDKNFFVDLADGLSGQLGALIVLSVNELGEPETMQQTAAGGAVRVINVRRPLHRGDPARFFHRQGNTWSYHHLHRPLQEITERHLTLVALAPRIGRLVREQRIDVVHFMDNFGLAMPWLRRRLRGVAVTVTALRYDPRGWPYRFYLRRAFGGLDGVACMTDAYRDILAGLGLERRRLATLRWGPAASLAAGDDAQRAVAARYGLGAHSPLLLWAGFIQQIAADSLHASVELARRLLVRLPELHVVLALKPESWRDAFGALGGERLHVERSVPDFPALLARADCLLSPVIKTSASVAPPLTWLEAMALGTPVATTAAIGVEEAVRDGETGLVAPRAAELEAPLAACLAAPQRLAELGRGARRLVRARFDLAAITAGYARFFAAAAAARRGAGGAPYEDVAAAGGGDR